MPRYNKMLSEEANEPVYQILKVADYDIANTQQYYNHRASTPSIGQGPRSRRTDYIHTRRLAQELALYRSYLYRGASMPHLSKNHDGELSATQADALFAEMEKRGVFDQLWGRHRGTRRGAVPSRRQIWDLMRDSGFGFGASYGQIEDEEKGTWSRVVYLS